MLHAVFEKIKVEKGTFNNNVEIAIVKEGQYGFKNT